MKKISTTVTLMTMLLLMAVPVSAQTAVDGSLGSGENPGVIDTGGEVGEEGGEQGTTDKGEEAPTKVVTTAQETQSTPELANTGVDAAMLALIAGGLLLAGGLALFATRRGGRAEQ